MANWPDGQADEIVSAWLDQVCWRARWHRRITTRCPDSHGGGPTGKGRIKDKLAKYRAEQTRRRRAGKLPRDNRRAAMRRMAGVCSCSRTRCIASRCHKVQGQGGEVGPELTGIGAKQDRASICSNRSCCRASRSPRVSTRSSSRRRRARASSAWSSPRMRTRSN